MILKFVSTTAGVLTGFVLTAGALLGKKYIEEKILKKKNYVDFPEYLDDSLDEKTFKVPVKTAIDLALEETEECNSINRYAEALSTAIGSKNVSIEHDAKTMKTIITVDTDDLFHGKLNKGSEMPAKKPSEGEFNESCDEELISAPVIISSISQIAAFEAATILAEGGGEEGDGDNDDSEKRTE